MNDSAPKRRAHPVFRSIQTPAGGVRPERAPLRSAAQAPGRFIVLVAALFALAGPGTAHAYLDPASGSMLLQAVIGGVAAAALALKFYWQRVAAFLRFGRADEPESE